MPVKHVVMFGFRPDTTPDEVEDFRQGLLAVQEACREQILSYELGTDLRLESGLNHPAGPNRQLLWSVTCPTVQDYLTYNDSVAHKEFVKKFAPILEPGKRAAVQYEIP